MPWRGRASAGSARICQNAGMAHAPLDITHDAPAQRFTTRVEGQLCEACYQLIGSTMVLTHTGVPGALEGRGIAAALVQAALTHARAQGLKVRPQCSYVQVYMRRHPETLDLLASA